MSKLLRVSVLVPLASLFAVSNLVAQEFENDEIDIVLNDYGRIRLYEVLGDGGYAKQLERLSILVAVDSGAVFDYKNDAESEDTARTVESPTLSDHELYCSTDYEYTYLPPDVLVKINVYGWNTGGYCVAKYTVINRESESIDAKIGFNFMPVIDDTWGESMAASYYADNDIAYGHRGDSTQIGFKFLSHELAACRIIDYADYSYETDTTLYTYVTYDGIDTDFVSPGADGPVVFPSIAAVTLATGDSVEVFVGIAFGRDSTSMVGNMTAAETAYGGLLGIDADTSPIPQAFVLKQNYPNPFNPGTAIEFDLNASGRVSLQVFNLRGQLVSTLVDNWLSAGNYTVMFDGADLPSGIYFYTLAAGRTFTTHKMVLLK